MEEKKGSAYNPEADRRWRQKNKERANYLTDRTSTRRFLKNKATLEDLEEMEEHIAKRRAELLADKQ